MVRTVLMLPICIHFETRWCILSILCLLRSHRLLLRIEKTCVVVLFVNPPPSRHTPDSRAFPHVQFGQDFFAEVPRLRSIGKRGS